MSLVNCMSCLVKLAQGCPTNGQTQVVAGNTCATVLTATLAEGKGRFRLPAHLFMYSRIANRWMSHDGFMPRWAVNEQRE